MESQEVRYFKYAIAQVDSEIGKLPRNQSDELFKWKRRLLEDALRRQLRSEKLYKKFERDPVRTERWRAQVARMTAANERRRERRQIIDARDKRNQKLFADSINGRRPLSARQLSKRYSLSATWVRRILSIQKNRHDVELARHDTEVFHERLASNLQNIERVLCSLTARYF